MNIDKLRFRNDDHNQYKSILKKSNGVSNKKKFELLSSSLKITKELTPELFKSVQKIECKLKINTHIEYYVRNDIEINASCFTIDNNDSLIVILTSGLVNIMSMDELSFIIGHEIGHYLLGHLDYICDTDDKRLIEYSQAREISADRIGFICSKDINTSIKAMIKTISGLNDSFISDNFHIFLHQHNKVSDKNVDLLSLSHPLLPTRAKSLMLFSMSKLFYEWKNNKKEAPIGTKELENSIQSYLYKTSLKSLIKDYSKIVSNFKMWALAKIFTDSGIFGEDEITILYKEIGKERAVKLRKYILDSDANQINAKYNESLIEFIQLPAKYKSEAIESMDNLTSNNSYTDLIRAAIYDNKTT